MTASARDAKVLARKFAENIYQVLSEGELTEVRRLNATAAYEGCCATHDFCDANYSMLLAYSVMACVPEDDVNVCDDDVMELMGQAWDIAKAAEFRKEDIK